MPTSVFDVRSATTRDAKAIAQLHNATVKEAFKGMLGDLDVAIMPLAERERYWSEAIQYAEPQVQVALHGAKIIGFVGYDRSRDEGTPATMGEIWAMYVDTDFWGSGCRPVLVGCGAGGPCGRGMHPCERLAAAGQ